MINIRFGDSVVSDGCDAEDAIAGTSGDAPADGDSALGGAASTTVNGKQGSMVILNKVTHTRKNVSRTKVCGIFEDNDEEDKDLDTRDENE